MGTAGHSPGIYRYIHAGKLLVVPGIHPCFLSRYSKPTVPTSESQMQVIRL